MKYFEKKNKGITLVALVITIVLLLILAGISIATLTGSGLFEKARLAEQESKNAQEKEESILADYEKQIENSRETVTIDKQEYEKLVNTVNELKTTKPTGIKTDAFIYNTSRVTSAYTNYTSMSGLTVSTDEENRIGEYLSYSADKGYTVLKSGWYYISMELALTAAASSCNAFIRLNLNGKDIADCRAYAKTDTNYNSQNTPIFLNKGDIVYFGVESNYATTVKNIACYCYPMF